MSTNNRISLTIPEGVLEVVNEKLHEIRTALAPYMQGLTNEERRDLPKMSDKSLSFHGCRGTEYRH